MKNVLLGFLLHKDMTGYDLRKELQRGTGYFYDSSYGSIYPALKKLEENKFIQVTSVTNKSKVKKVHTITEEGIKEFNNWLSKPAEEFKLKYEFLAKIFFSSERDDLETIEAIEFHIHELTISKKEMELTYENIKEYCDRYQLYTLNFGIEYVAFLIRWCKDLIKDISKE